MRQWPLAVLGLFLCSIFGVSPASAQLTGMIPDGKAGAKPSAVRLESLPRARAAALPAKVKNITYLPVVRNQGLANCGAFSPTYYLKTWQEAKEHGWVRPDPDKNPERIMSPGFTFPLTNGGQNNGANIGHVMEVICRYGCADWKTMPETSDYTTYPSEAAWRNAIKYRSSQVLSIDPSKASGITLIKEQLAAGNLVTIGALLYHDTYDQYPTAGVGVDTASGVIYDHGYTLWDYHAFTIIGYDDDKAYDAGGVAGKGAFLAVNSWGTGWGVTDADAGSAGFVWFSYDYIMNKRGGLSGAAYTMVDRIGYAPTELAVLDMWVNRRAYLTMSIYPGSPYDRLAASLEAFPNGGGDQYFTGRIVLDVTDFASLSPVAYTVDAIDDSAMVSTTEGGAKTGAITGLTIEKANGQKIRANISASDPISIYALPDYSSLADYVSVAHAGALQERPIGLDDLTTQALSAAWCDWNRDGAPDLALSGSFLISSRMLRAYRNITVTSTTLQNLESPDPSPGFVTSRLAWGDYDNDGFPDIAVGGQIYTQNGTSWDSVCAVKIYRNLQTGRFADSGIALPAVSTSGLAWGDVNNDGRVDLAFTGGTDTGKLSKLYLNGGGGKFTDSGVALPTSLDPALSFADMNNDGWLDLAIGNEIYKNNGASGTFTKVATLADGYNSVHAWGDYNGDGLLDLAYARINDNYGGQRELTTIYRNDGNFAFTEVDAGLAGVYDGSLAWADMDNDGRLDLAVAGYPEDDWTSKTTRVYRQVSSGKFQDSGAYLVPAALGTVGWADFDSDGDADLLVTGHSIDTDTQFLGATKFYASQVSQPDAMNRRNTAPTVPVSSMAVEYDSTNKLVKLKWGAQTDAQTPKYALGYRLRVGTYPGASDVVSPHGDLTINGPHPHMMISSTQPGRLLKGLQAGRYYWAVQTVDAGLACSAWSEEKSFVLGSSGLVTGDANRDGKINVADVVAASLMAQGKTTAQPQYADLDGNGKVESLDAWMIARKLVALDGASAYMPVVSGAIGSAGGTLGAASDGLQIVVPASAFPAAAQLSLEVMGGSVGPDSVPLTWRLKGLPPDFKSPVKVRMKDIRSNTALTPFIRLQRPGFSNTLSGATTGTVVRQATKASDGWLEVTIDEPGARTSADAASIAKAAAPTLMGDAADPLAGYDYTFVMNLLSEDQYRYDGGHFRITAAAKYKDNLPQIATDLEDAYAYYTNTLGFDLSRRNWTKYPLEVCVMDLGKGSSGEPVNAYTVSSISYNGISIELNQLILSERNAVRTTLAHEFFHVVQALYDSRNRVARATSNPDLWVDEATATYLESHFATIDGWQSDVLMAYKFMMFNGYEQAERFWGSTAQNYGYGAACLIANLVYRNGNNPAIIKTIYDKKKAGTKGLYALAQSATGYPLATWFTSLFENMLTGKIYPSMITPAVLKNDVAGKKRTLTLKTERQRGGHLPETCMSDLSANMTVMMFDDPLLNVQSGDKLGFQLKTDEPLDHNLAVMSMTRSGGTSAFTKLGEAAYDSNRKALRLVVPNAANYIKKNTWLVPIVANTDMDLPFDNQVASTLYYGVFRDYSNQPITEHTQSHGHIYFGAEEIPFPTIKQSGKFSANDVTLLYERYKTNTDPSFIPNVQIYMWGEPNDPVPFEFSASFTSTSYTGMSTDGRNQYVITITSPMQYQVRKYRGMVYGPFDFRTELVSTGPWTSSPNGSFTLDDGEDANIYMIDMKFSYNIKVYDTQNENALLANYDSERTPYGFDLELFRN
ncbi:MAG: FG-GAP-like repeat-containing protein [Candidatus Sumerlaeia bacterium]